MRCGVALSSHWTYSALIDARLPFTEIDFGIYGFRDVWENVKILVCGLKNGLPEFLVEANSIFWVIIVWGQEYQILSTNCQKMRKSFSKIKINTKSMSKSYEHHIKSYEFPDVSTNSAKLT